MRKVKYLLLFISTSFYALAQQHYDRLTPLSTNPVLVNLARQKAVDKIGPPPNNPIKILGLPFLDDFAKPQPFPDTAIWINGGVFTNYTYPTSPRTLGVATFDGVNSYGVPYDPTVSPFSSNPADTLTSQYIGLSKYSPSDSLYLSFYWEAAGLGSPPKTNDSLILEFSNGNGWHEVWYHLGYQPVPPDTGFHFVIIPIVNQSYFLNSFQFRFRNYACIAGNLDHWHIDEVFLNEGRSYNDSVQKNDIAFMYESPTFLNNNYQYMPWEQFTAADIKDSIYLAERDNDISGVNMTFGYKLTGPTNSNFLGSVDNVSSYFTNGANTNRAQCNPPLLLTYTPLTAPATWSITYSMSSSTTFPELNLADTLRYAQTFSNYYAYDDGSAESNYSVIPFNDLPTELSERIKLNQTDTLLGVELFFNYVLTDARSYIFRLTVWGDSNGSPKKEPIYEDSNLYDPYYYVQDSFVYYKMKYPPILNGTVYVGLVQTDGDTLNIGFDLNTDSQSQIFYNVGYGWLGSDFPGSLMMRPVFGNRVFNTVNEVSNTRKSEITLYPNPARDEVKLSETMKPNTALRIYGSDGRLWYENLDFRGDNVNTSSLPTGFYILEITPKDSQAGYKKLLISR